MIFVSTSDTTLRFFIFWWFVCVADTCYSHYFQTFYKYISPDHHYKSTVDGDQGVDFFYKFLNHVLKNQVVESSMEQIFCKVYTKTTILVILLPDGDDSIAKHRQAPFFSSLLESWKCNLMWINFSRQQKQQYCSGHKTQDSRLLKLFSRFLHRQLSITDHTKYNQWMKKNITISLFICCELWLALACSTLLAAAASAR